jgi:hypothetical protein
MKIVLMFRTVGDILPDVLYKTNYNQHRTTHPALLVAVTFSSSKSEYLCLSTQTHLQHICVEEVVA